MRYAIIEASGRQFWAEPKKFIEFNRLPINIGSIIIMRRILCYRCYGSDANPDNCGMELGRPYLTNVLVKGIISKHFLGPKLIVFKMKPKKKYRKKLGHRQKLTRFFINSVNRLKREIIY
uniref:50S ribosomal protein L21 n=1 Tax=Phaeostrophion irregulare TaxID=243268 RepID=UPI002E767768|nr:50S ribosomal protein L21 [Phaeostrophion irregulare]YP_011007078.1 50S ribosomal protein L21 [Phaeostrophion irregulare]WAM64284.1 50S ribosomal protein L21 [Phaeostrophion irregulare]WAM64365.1 50S ribosomal protein L21 [Phaeostrophion irregulare]